MSATASETTKSRIRGTARSAVMAVPSGNRYCQQLDKLLVVTEAVQRLFASMRGVTHDWNWHFLTVRCAAAIPAANGGAPDMVAMCQDRQGLTLFGCRALARVDEPNLALPDVRQIAAHFEHASLNERKDTGKQYAVSSLEVWLHRRLDPF